MKTRQKGHNGRVKVWPVQAYPHSGRDGGEPVVKVAVGDNYSPRVPTPVDAEAVLLPLDQDYKMGG